MIEKMVRIVNILLHEWWFHQCSRCAGLIISSLKLILCMKNALQSKVKTVCS